MNETTTTSASEAFAGPPSQREYDTNNRWILVERGNRLLALGDLPFKGTSIRRALDAPGRALIPTAVKSAMNGIDVVDEVAELNGVRRRVSAYAIRTPRTGTIAAVHAIHSAVNDDRPTRPLVGTWEWEVPADHPEQMTTHWDTNLFRLYGESVEGLRAESNGSQAPEWLNTRIVETDRLRVKRILDEYVREHDAKLLGVEQYEIITGAESAAPGTRRLQMAGRSTFDISTRTIWMQGVSHELVSEHAGASLAEEFLASTFLLVADEILAAVDLAYDQVFFRSQGWDDSALIAPANGSLAGLALADDAHELKAVLHAAAATQGVAVGKRLIQLASVSGSWTRGQVSASSVDAAGRYVLLRFMPV
ncbi:hypothetical protein [Leifsonia aquatica]|uniref:hypothetical protein n=1 Tax=Leifsonia aquatica TaxID=144185 RepID=UPI003812BCB5